MTDRLQSGTRSALLSSWHGAKRQADRVGGVTLNSTSWAGYAIEQAGGSVRMARALVPDDATPFWGRVRECLDRVESEERQTSNQEVGRRIHEMVDAVIGKVPA